MPHSIDTLATVGADETVTIKLPGVPPGEVRIVATVESAQDPRRTTGAELVAGEFFGDLKDEPGWPDTPEMFREWRRRLWERPLE